MKALIFILRI